jgi:hypothetical protein
VLGRVRAAAAEDGHQVSDLAQLGDEDEGAVAVPLDDNVGGDAVDGLEEMLHGGT